MIHMIAVIKIVGFNDLHHVEQRVLGQQRRSEDGSFRFHAVRRYPSFHIALLKIKG